MPYSNGVKVDDSKQMANIFNSDYSKENVQFHNYRYLRDSRHAVSRKNLWGVMLPPENFEK